MNIICREICSFIKNPIVILFLSVFGFIQFIIIIAALSSSNNPSYMNNYKPVVKRIKLDFRYKTAFKVESLNETQGTSNSKFIPYGSEDYQYPLLVDMPDLVDKLKNNKTVSIKPINDFNFKYSLANFDMCKGFDKKVDNLVLVKSSVTNKVNRDVIRSTWGKDNCWGGRLVRTIFLFGQLLPNNKIHQKQLNLESKAYNDVLQGNFIDSYYNNTYKIMMAFDFATRYCKAAKFITFIDDDFFLHPRAVMSYLDSISEPVKYRLFSGYVWRRAIPNRNHRRKWSVSQNDYPYDFYPAYCAAGNFFVSMEVAIDISHALKYTKYLRFDDVFLGIVLHKLLIVPIHLSEVYSYGRISTKSKDYPRMISSHGFKSSVEMFKTWMDLNCSEFCLHTPKYVFYDTNNENDDENSDDNFTSSISSDDEDSNKDSSKDSFSQIFHLNNVASNSFMKTKL